MFAPHIILIKTLKNLIKTLRLKLRAVQSSDFCLSASKSSTSIHSSRCFWRAPWQKKSEIDVKIAEILWMFLQKSPTNVRALLQKIFFLKSKQNVFHDTSNWCELMWVDASWCELICVNLSKRESNWCELMRVKESELGWVKEKLLWVIETFQKVSFPKKSLKCRALFQYIHMHVYTYRYLHTVTCKFDVLFAYRSICI